MPNHPCPKALLLGRALPTHTFLFGGRGPGHCLGGNVQWRQEHPSMQTSEQDHADKASVLPNAFDIDFTWGLPLSFRRFWKRMFVVWLKRRADLWKVEQTFETLSRSFQQRAASLEKVPGSCNCFQAWSFDLLRQIYSWKNNSRFGWRRRLWHGSGATRGTEEQERVITTLCWCEHGV